MKCNSCDGKGIVDDRDCALRGQPYFDSKPCPMCAPVTAEELAEVDRLVRVRDDRESVGFDISLAEKTLAVLGNTLLPRLAADLRAIESMLSEAGMVRREGDTTRSLLARLIADANDAQRDHDTLRDAILSITHRDLPAAEMADDIRDTVAGLASSVERADLAAEEQRLVSRDHQRLEDRVMRAEKERDAARAVAAQAEALMADRERMSRDLARMQLQLMQAQATAIAEGRAAK